MLGTLDSKKLYKDSKAFLRDLRDACKATGLRISSAELKTVLAALSERDESAKVCVDKKGDAEPDSLLRDTEIVPFKEDIQDYFKREVIPHVPDAWIDESKTKIGYEVPLTRHFYTYNPPRPLEVIQQEITDLEKDIVTMLRDVTGSVAE